MPTVIDSLVVELGLDPSKFTEAQKQALDAFKKSGEEATKLGNQIEAQGAKITDFFGGMKREAIGLLGVFLAGRGIKDFTTYITTLDAATSRTAKTLNIATSELSAWQGAMEQSGGTAESITSTMQGLSGSINTFLLTGQGPFIGITTAMGLSLFDVNKKLKTSDELLLEISDRIKGMDPARASALLSMIPGMNQDTINLLLLGRDAIQKYLVEARKAGGTTTESAEAAKKFQENLTLLERSAISVSRALLTDLMPAITSFMDSMRGMIQGGVTEGKPFWDWFFGMPKVSIVPGSLAATIRDFLAGWFSGGSKSMKDLVGPGPAAASTLPAGAPSAGPGRAPAGSSAATGEALTTVTTPGGRKVTVSASAAGDFEGFLAELERRGAPIGSLGGYSNRNIAGTGTLSEHAKGRAIDMGSMVGRDQIDPGLRAWISSHPQEWRDLLARYNMKSGGDFRNPDLGHVEWKGPFAPGIGGPPIGGSVGAPAAAGITNNTDRRSESRSSTTNSVQVGTVQIHAPNAKNADDIASEIPNAIKRTNWAASADYGLTG